MRYYIDLKGIGSIMRNPNYSDKEKVLLYIISDHCQFCQNTGKVCELSYSLIKKWTGWGDHTIQNTIASLVEKGDITYTTERLQGNRKSTAIVSTGYCRSDSNSTVETAVQGTVVTAVNNKQKKQENNSTIDISTSSYKYGSEPKKSDCIVRKDTTFFDGEDKPGGNAEPHQSELKKTLDNLEWGIANDVWLSDVSFDLAFDTLKRKVEGLDINYEYLRGLFDRKQKEKERQSMTRICANL